MMIEWKEIEPGTYEARVGSWLLEVGRNDAAQPWRVWVGMMAEDERAGGVFFCRSVTGSLDEAQRAAVALAVEKCAPFVATARAEAALAEREACEREADRIAKEHKQTSFTYPMASAPWVRHVDKSDGANAVAAAIRARTTPATLSTETLAAIAEARGLRVVTAERVAELEAAAKSEQAQLFNGAARLF